MLFGYQAGRSASASKGVVTAGASGRPAKEEQFQAELSEFAQDLAGVGTNKEYEPLNLTDDMMKSLNSARAAASASPLVSLSTKGGADVQERLANELHLSVLDGVSALLSSFSPEDHPKLQRALSLVGAASQNVEAAYIALLPVVSERVRPEERASEQLEKSRNATLHLLTMVVSEKPFGMHVKRGTLLVEEVFPGFLAHKAGVRKGCELREVAGQKALPGNWLELFQKNAVPFPVKLACGTPPQSGGALSGDPHRYRVMVTKKPYGMNVQVNVLPRVVEVLPGYPAEAAGIQRGFVLTEVNELPVDASNWFQQYQSSELPFTLTFDTDVPVKPGNPFFEKQAKDEEEKAPPTEEPPPTVGYTDFKCTVEKLPFGMQVKALPHHNPKVDTVVLGSPAASVGVQPGDVLVEVAGRAVTSATWFASLQQAVPPFGLLFKRPVAGSAAVAPPVAPAGTAAPPAGTAAPAAPAGAGGSGHHMGHPRRLQGLADFL